MSIEFKHAVTINCDTKTAYEAIVLAKNIVNFFPNESSGDLQVGSLVEWTWDTMKCPVTVNELEENKRISFSWQAYKIDYDTTSIIELEEKGAATKVSVKEYGWKEDENSIASAVEHSSGWMHFLLCMKAWVEHGIDLRA